MPMGFVQSAIESTSLVTRYSLLAARYSLLATRYLQIQMRDNAIWSLISVGLNDVTRIVSMGCACVCVGSYNQSGLSLSGRGGVAGISLARMQCDTVTILMPNTYLITRSAKIWYPYRFLFSFISLVFFISLFSFLFFWVFLFCHKSYAQWHVSVMPYKRCQTMYIRMPYVVFLSLLFSFFFLFFFFLFIAHQQIHTYTLMYSYAPMCMCILCCTLSLYFKYQL